MLIFILLVLSISAQAQCPHAPLKPYKSTGKGYYYILEVPEEVLSARPHNNFRYLSRFQREVKHKTSVDPIDLLKRQLEFYKDDEEERIRFEKIINHEVGKIRGINCLEALLMDAHIGQFSERSEFQAFVLSRGNSRLLRALVSTQNSRVSVGQDDHVQRLKERYLSQGWRLERHLHNHPFSFDNRYGDIAGTVIPSPTDLNTYKHLKRREGLKSSSVTNGFNTFDLHAREFEDLSRSHIL